MLSRTLKMTLWVMYDHLGKLVLINVLWVMALSVPGTLALVAFLSGDMPLALYVGVPVLYLMCGVIIPVSFAGIAHLTKILIETRDGSIRDFFAGMRLYGLRATGLSLVYGIVMACLVVSMWFYSVKLHDTVPWLGYGLSAIALWVLVFVWLSAMYAIPALVQKKGGVWATLKLSAVLVLDNPMFSVALALQFVVLASFSLVPFVLFLISASLAMVMATSAYEMLARRYALVEAATVEAKAAGIPLTRNMILSKARAASDEEEAQDEYLNRGFRDFLFPWKG